MSMFSKHIIVSIIAALLLIGCGGGGSSSSAVGAGAGANGAGVKGPFVQGSTVIAYKLNTDGTKSTTDFNSTITTDNLGNYNLSGIPWTGPTQIVISGNYFNENTGTTSTTTISLSCVVEIASGQSVHANINVFTDLEAQRIIYLMAHNSLSYVDAKVQARATIVDLFDLNMTSGTNLEDLNLLDGSEHPQSNAELLRVSSALAIDPSILAGLRAGIVDGNMTNDPLGHGSFVRLGNLVDDVNLTRSSDNLEADLNITGVPDANDTTALATYVIRGEHAPVLDPIADVTIDEDSGIYTITLNATDSDGGPLFYSATTDWSILGGTGSGISGNVLSIVPKTNKNGVRTVTALVEDNTSLETSRTFTVTINPVNDAPVANDDSATTSEDTNKTIDVLVNDTDVDGDSLSISRVTQPSNGTVTIGNGSLNVMYTPNANYHGADSFTYTVSDGSGGTNTATVTMTITSVNDVPVANDDANTTAEDTATTIDVLANDTDVDGDSLSVFDVTQPSNGTVTIGNGSLNVMYTPNANYHGTDSFTYTVSDGNGGTNTATVTMTITSVNDAPVADDDTIAVTKDTTYTGTLIASDVDGDTLTYSLVGDANTDSNGTVNITDSATGAYSYAPASGFEGDSSFTFKATDSNSTDSNTATITIHVTDRVINITANDDTASVAEDTNVTIDVLANDTSIFADDSSDASGTNVTDVSSPTHGTATIISNKIKYVPNANYHGSDSFMYEATSASGSKDGATVTVTVTPVNHAPVASNGNVSTTEDVSLSTTVPTATDVDGNLDINGYVLVTDVTQGSLTFNADGTFTFDPNREFESLATSDEANVTFIYRASDLNDTQSNEANVTITVTGVNDTPTVEGGMNDDTVFVGDIINETVPNDAFSDVDSGDTLSYTASGLPEGIVLSSRGNFTGSPTTAGEYDITVTATDLGGLAAHTTFHVTVNYAIQASDVNNTSIIFVDKSKISFYADGTFVNTGFDGNESWYDQGLWDINDTVHAVQLIYSNSSMSLLALQDTPVVGGILTFRSIDPNTQEDDSGFGIIKKVIDIKGTILPEAISANDINNTAMRVVDGVNVHFFSDSRFLEIGTNDNNISQYYKTGYWRVVGGVIGILNEYHVSEANITISSTNPTEGTLGLHRSSDGVSKFVVRSFTDINGTLSDNFNATIDGVKSKVIVFTDGLTLILYGVNSDNTTTYWLKGRSEDGVEEMSNHYIIDNGDIVLQDANGAAMTILSLNAPLANGSSMLATYPQDDNSTDHMVVRDVFGYHGLNGDQNGVALATADIENKTIEFANGESYTFFKDGLYRMNGLSNSQQKFYSNYGTWSITNTNQIHLTYVDGTEGKTSDIQLNELPQKGTRSRTYVEVNSSPLGDYGSVIKNVFDLDPNAARVDMYPEYDVKVSNDAGNIVVNQKIVTVNGQDYTVIPFSVTPSVYVGSQDTDLAIEFYGDYVGFKLAPSYIDNNIAPILLKVYKGTTTQDDSTFVGSFGPFFALSYAINNGILYLGNRPFNH